MNDCVKRAKDIKESEESATQPNPTLAFDTIFYTDEQCQDLHNEYVRQEALGGPIEGVAHGDDAEPGEFPFMAAILNREPDGSYMRQCGGSIITKR